MGFVTRHANRDLMLPDQREKLLGNVLNDLKNDKDVIGIYLGGSLAKGNDDIYSDIDLHIIVTPETKADFIKNKRKRPAKWGNVLFFEGLANTPVIVTHFDCFVKVDTFYKEPADLEPSIWLKGLKVLYDPKGIVQKVLNQSSEMKYLPTAEEVEVWRGKMLAFIHETYRAVMRKESYYSLANLDRIRWLIAYGWYMEMNKRIDSSYGIWSKIEGERSFLNDWQLSLVESWDSSRQSLDVMKTMTSIIPEFLRLNKQLCDQTGLETREEWCKKIIQMVM